MDFEGIHLNNCTWEVRADDGTWHERTEADALLVLIRFGAHVVRVRE